MKGLFFFPGTKQTVCNNEVSVLSCCPCIKRALTVSQFNFYLQNCAQLYLLLINMSMVSSISVLPHYGNRYNFSSHVIDKLQAFGLPEIAVVDPSSSVKPGDVRLKFAR